MNQASAETRVTRDRDQSPMFGSIGYIQERHSSATMDLITFIAEISKAIAWPIAAITIALVFRGELKGLMTRVKKGKLGPAEFEFEQSLREIRQELPPDIVRIELRNPVLRPQNIAKREARSVVIDAWLQVEQAMNTLAIKHNTYNALAGPDSASNANALAKRGIIEPWILNMYRDLRRLRNQASHESTFEPSEESVVSFVQTASDLRSVLEGLQNSH